MYRILLVSLFLALCIYPNRDAKAVLASPADVVSAADFPGADWCAKIVAAANSAYSNVNKQGFVIDARGFHGTQTCAPPWIFSGWPFGWPPGQIGTDPVNPLGIGFTDFKILTGNYDLSVVGFKSNTITGTTRTLGASGTWPANYGYVDTLSSNPSAANWQVGMFITDASGDLMTGSFPAGTRIAAINPILSLTTNNTTASGNNTLHFADTTKGTPTFPYNVLYAGMVIADTTNPSVIPANTTISSVTGTTVVMSANATGAGVSTSDVITFTCSPCVMVNPAPGASHTLNTLTVVGGTLEIPSETTLVGDASNGAIYGVTVPYGASYGGFIIHPDHNVVLNGVKTAQTWPSNIPVVEMGNPFVPNQYAIRIFNVGIYCPDPTGAVASGSVGLMNIIAQEGSYVRDSQIKYCTNTNVALGYGNADNGGYENLDLTTTQGATTSTCMNIFSGLGSFKINSISCPSVANNAINFSIDATNVRISDLHTENGIVGIAIGFQSMTLPNGTVIAPGSGYASLNNMSFSGLSGATQTCAGNTMTDAIKIYNGGQIDIHNMVTQACVTHTIEVYNPINTPIETVDGSVGTWHRDIGFKVDNLIVGLPKYDINHVFPGKGQNYFHQGTNSNIAFVRSDDFSAAASRILCVGDGPQYTLPATSGSSGTNVITLPYVPINTAIGQTITDITTAVIPANTTISAVTPYPAATQTITLSANLTGNIVLNDNISVGPAKVPCEIYNTTLVSGLAGFNLGPAHDTYSGLPLTGTQIDIGTAACHGGGGTCANSSKGHIVVNSIGGVSAFDTQDDYGNEIDMQLMGLGGGAGKLFVNPAVLALSPTSTTIGGTATITGGTCSSWKQGLCIAP